jgi:hypothetical protein
MKKTFKVKYKELVQSIQLNNGKILYMNNHSKNRVDSRQISSDHIIETFTNPDTTFPNKDYGNVKNYQKEFDGKTLKIGVKNDEEPFVLVTAFYRDL